MLVSSLAGKDFIMNAYKTAVGALLHIIAHKRRSEALGIIKTEVVNLGLGMVVGRITRPSAGVVEHLAEHHI